MSTVRDSSITREEGHMRSLVGVPSTHVGFTPVTESIKKFHERIIVKLGGAVEQHRVLEFPTGDIAVDTQFTHPDMRAFEKAYYELEEKLY